MLHCGLGYCHDQGNEKHYLEETVEQLADWLS